MYNLDVTAAHIKLPREEMENNIENSAILFQKI